MNMKENIIFLRNELTTTGEVDTTDRTELGKCIHLYDVAQGNNETQALSTKNCLRQMQEKYIIIKEEGSEEEDRQEEPEGIFVVVVKNGYADLKRRHQNAKIRKIFKWADRGKH